MKKQQRSRSEGMNAKYNELLKTLAKKADENVMMKSRIESLIQVMEMKRK